MSAVVLGAGTAEDVRDSLYQLRVRVPDDLWDRLDELVMAT